MVIIEARQQNMTEAQAHKTYTKVPTNECHDVTGEEPVGTKWLEVNKGDEDEFDIRAQLVAQEFSQGKLGTIFASTPPVEAKKALVSLPVQVLCTTTDGILIRIKRAYL